VKFISYATNKHDLSLLKECSYSEVILSFEDLNRLIKTSYDDFIELCQMAKTFQMRVILEWDVLATENDFAPKKSLFDSIPAELYDAIRVQDPGVLEYVLGTTDKPIQFIAETGNHNLKGLKVWEEYIGHRLERLVLSIELNKDKIKEYTCALKTPTELLVAGRVLLFYSPRKLLSPLALSEAKAEYGGSFLEAVGSSEESPHKGFPLVENQHGTFMFHIKDLFLLDRYEQLEQTGLDWLRIDLRDRQDLSFLKTLHEFLAKPSFHSDDLKEAYGKEVIRGYFQTNKSDVLFKKLKNYRVQRKDEAYIGEVVEIAKPEYMALELKSHLHLKKDSQLKIINPNGKEFFCKVHFLKDLAFDDLPKTHKGQLVLMNYMGGVWPKSQVYLDS
jgi:putative protease